MNEEPEFRPGKIRPVFEMASEAHAEAMICGDQDRSVCSAHQMGRAIAFVEALTLLGKPDEDYWWPYVYRRSAEIRDSIAAEEQQARIAAMSEGLSVLPGDFTAEDAPLVLKRFEESFGNQ